MIIYFYSQSFKYFYIKNHVCAQSKMSGGNTLAKALNCG